ncbi:MAG: hopanoid biosynthesis-associated protein HpnK [Gammaproteobacteria bacterium]|nr:hopanoid biosynthesis-associated protein HpnK [Gammaproteobacteria bacterium]
MGKFLIVTADDFGLHERVNEAVDAAHRYGVLTSASLMVAAPAAADAVRRARNLPNLRVGLHLVLADGPAALPAAEIRSLVDAHGRFDDRMFVNGVRYFFSPRVRRQLEAEIRAQFAAFRATGLALDHADAHKHFHLHPTLLGLMLRVGAEFGLRAVRVPDEPSWFGTRAGGIGPAAGGRLLAPWLALMKRRLRRADVLCNDRIFGLARTGSMDEAALLEVLARLPEGVTEIYGHPAAGEGPVTATMRGYRHAEEFAALQSPRVRAATARIDTGGYSDLATRLRGASA